MDLSIECVISEPSLWDVVIWFAEVLWVTTQCTEAKTQVCLENEKEPRIMVPTQWAQVYLLNVFKTLAANVV